MTKQRITVEALSITSFAAQLAALPHETRATITATEHGTAWATVDISPLTGDSRAVFPCDSDGYRGDTAKRGQAGVIVSQYVAPGPDHALRVVIERARRMAVTPTEFAGWSTPGVAL